MAVHGSARAVLLYSLLSTLLGAPVHSPGTPPAEQRGFRPSPTIARIERCSTAPPETIDVRIRAQRQLFNTLDATPFPEKDLDADADDFIYSWALELAGADALVVRIFVAESTPGDLPSEDVAAAIQNYYHYRADILRRQWLSLRTRGYMSLLIGLACLTASITGAELIDRYADGMLFSLLRQGLIIGGWVAMWGPLQIFLHEWWPLRDRRRVCERLANARIEVHLPAATTPALVSQTG